MSEYYVKAFSSRGRTILTLEGEYSPDGLEAANLFAAQLAMTNLESLSYTAVFFRGKASPTPLRMEVFDKRMAKIYLDHREKEKVK
jgi:hypothetical protein